MKANQDIRQEAATVSVRLWRIGERLGLNDGNFSRKLRHELPPKEKEKIRSILAELAKEV